ncbi:hypothetical protein R6Q57_024364 [Mikania cordata]
MSEPAKDYNQQQHPEHYQDQQQPPHHYGTFQGVNNYPPSAPPCAGAGHRFSSACSSSRRLRWSVSQPLRPWLSGRSRVFHVVMRLIAVSSANLCKIGYAIAEGRPVRERRLPCCGIGMGWFLFIVGFFLAAIPWYIGSIHSNMCQI